MVMPMIPLATNVATRTGGCSLVLGDESDL
jgi:hypothetical protein